MLTNLVIDIGSSSVGATLVSVAKDVAPKIVFSTRLSIPLQSGSDNNRSLTSITTALDSVIKTVSAEHFIVHKSHIIFSSPWYVSKTNILKIDFNTPTNINHHTINQLIKDAEKKFVEETHLDGEVVERRIIRIRLNGYDTVAPYNKKAKNVEVALLTTIVAKDVLESIRRVVDKYFHIKNNEISSFSLATFVTISGIVPSEKDFVIIDVRGEVTDISLIYDGALVKSLSFPIGKNTLITSISNNSGQTKEAALSLINLIAHGNNDQATQDEFIKLSEGFKQSWLQSYTATVQNIYTGVSGTTTPQVIYLIADTDVENYFENILKETRQEGKLLLLRHLNLRQYLETSSVSTDSVLALESIFDTITKVIYD